MKSYPLVSVVTPVHNAQAYLAECIESVLRQTYQNWQYIIVDNCSTDSSLDIAKGYAALDSRISVLSNKTFVGSIENHNIAVQQISKESKYCKVVSADDWLFPECLVRLVELAEAHPNVGIIGSYQLSGCEGEWKVRWDEIRYPSPVTPGRDVCRSHLLGGPYILGTPTSTLYRADLVRERPSFYPHLLPHADTSACYECLQNSDLGFVHQVLSFERIHADTISAECKKVRTYESALLRNLIAYGPVYLTRKEYSLRIKEVLAAYHKTLAVGLFNFKGAEYWKYHKSTLAQLGFHCFGYGFIKAVLAKFLDLALNPKQTLEKIFKKKASTNRILSFSHESTLCTGLQPKGNTDEQNSPESVPELSLSDNEAAGGAPN